MLDDQTTSDTTSETTPDAGGPGERPGDAPPVDVTADAAPPARAPRKRAPRKTAAKKATEPAGDAAASEPGAPAAADVPAHHPPAKKTTRARKSTARAAVSASEPGGAAEANAEGIAPAQAVDAPGLSAVPPADQSADQPDDSVGAEAGASAAAATTPLFQPPSAAAAPAKRAPRKRTAKKTAPPPAPQPDAASDAAGDTAVAAAPTEPLPIDFPVDTAAVDAPSEAAVEAPAETPDEDELALADGDAAPGAPDGSADAESADRTDEELTDDAALAIDVEPVDPADAVPDDTDEADRDGGPRRRRRRGGRRRRKGGEGRDSRGDEDSDTDEVSADGPQGDDAAVSPDDAGTPATEEGSEGDKAEGGGSTRRRRRRRRSGDGDDAATGDDPENTVTKVRKGRSAEDEITGFTGSTRLEAKKQRRREGREAGRRRAPIISEAEFLARRESVDRTMVIRQRGDLTQIAVLEDNVLVEHYVARESQTSLMGNVYLGRVQNVLPSMEAAFVDIGKGRNAVLYAGEVNWDSFGVKDGQRKIEQVLKSGQTVLVQVSKDPVGHKGARLTSQVSLPGRFLVYVPDGTTSGISRKLPDNERTRLKTLLKEIVPEGAGVIVRTAAEGASEEELTRDVERLKARWEEISAKVASGNAPQLLYGEPDLTLKVVRDLFTEDFAKLVISGDDAWELVRGYVEQVAPDLLPRMEKHDDAGGNAFADLRIDEQIAKALDRKVYLPSGGSLVIDRTEAMTVVDVNTGKFTGSGGNLEETVTKNNLEAAEEIVRQLRLRDIGGIIVVDFIDMVLESNRDLVLRRLVECLGRDRTRHQVAEVTSLGLVQMTRKRIGTGLLEAFSEPCEACQGRGAHVHVEPVPDKRRPVEDEQPSRSGRSGRSGRRGRGEDRSEEASGRGSAAEAAPTPPKRPTPADFAAMARAEVASAAAAAAAAAEDAATEDAAAEDAAADDPTVGDPTTEVPAVEAPAVDDGAVDSGAVDSEPVDATAAPVTTTGDELPAPAEESTVSEQGEGLTPAQQAADPQDADQPAAATPTPEPVAAAPRLVTSVRRRSARRPAGPPAGPPVAATATDPTATTAHTAPPAGPDGVPVDEQG